MQELQARAWPLQLVVMQQGQSATEPVMFGIKDETDGSASTFMFMVVRLPTTGSTGALRIAHEQAQHICCQATDDYSTPCAVGFADCNCTLECAAPGVAAFVVYAIRAAQVISTCKFFYLPPAGLEYGLAW